MLRVERVSKTFGDVRALRNVSLEFFPGEVHAVLGENGAGKSTLMSVLAGFVVPDSGSIVLSPAVEIPFGRPHEIKRLGIEMVHQHFMLVREFSVAENFALGTLNDLRGTLDLGASKSRALKIAQELGWELDMDAETRSLPVGSQQRLEIVKALAGEARVLILDEPTAVLAPHEVEDLARVLKGLRNEGKCVILIAHKLSEVLAIADRVSVLRRGELVASAPRNEVEEQTLIEWMVGEVPNPSHRPSVVEGEPLLVAERVEVQGDRGVSAVRGVSFTVRRGEILGIGGVDGNGQSELAEAIVGLRRLLGGRLSVESSERRVGYIPQDRHEQGLALGMTIADNFLIGGSGDLWVGPFLRRRRLEARVAEVVARFEIKAGGLNDPARSLSGGNQQKLVVSRVFDSLPDVLVAYNPTRGLDVRAAAFVRERLLEAASRGAAVVLLSSDLDELAEIATRTAFMSRGELREGGAEALVG